MTKIIGIRREDKNEWERRVPLIPEHVIELLNNEAVQTHIQPGKIRIFPDGDYQKAGAVISEDLTAANPIFAVKEIPADFLEPEKTYIFFSHVVKGQSYNMDMLRKMMELKVNLIDYERIVDESGRRLIFFGRYAGLAGMVETFHAFGQKLLAAGISSPFDKFKQAYECGTLDQAKTEIAAVGKYIAEQGFPAAVAPVVVGFAGYGNVSQGAQEIIDLMPCIEITPQELIGNYDALDSRHHLYKVVFKEVDMVQPKAGEFELQEYYNQPEKYNANFDQYLSRLSLLVNCIFWTEQYPRLVTKEYLSRAGSGLKLQVIGDISCDIEGSIEITHKVTYPDKPTYTYLPAEDEFIDGTVADGITVMAVDNLPCEFPRESSAEFSQVLKEFVKIIAEADFSVPLEDLRLPDPIKKALILHQGELTPEYEYIREFL